MGRPTAPPHAGRGRLERAAPSRRSAWAWGILPALLWPSRARLRGGARGLATAAREQRADAGSALGPGGPMAAHVETATAPHCSTSALLLTRLISQAGPARALRVRARRIAQEPRSDAGLAQRPRTMGRCGPSTLAAPVPVAVVWSGSRPRAGRYHPPRRSRVSSLAGEPAGIARVGRWAAAQRQVSSFSGPSGKRCDVMCGVWVWASILYIYIYTCTVFGIRPGPRTPPS